MKNDKRVQEIEELALELGLDPFPVVYEIIERSTMFNICAYGLPSRPRHWSYGRSYDHQKTYGEMGFSKVFEVILNNNPAYAFLLDTNTEVQNLFIVAHCLGHSSFFKNNYLFKNTNRNMIKHSAEHSGRVEEYIDKFGFEKVEHLMDIGFALNHHINWNRGLYRKKYEKKNIRYKETKSMQFDDMLLKRSQPSFVKVIDNEKFPPHNESDLLWFFINYAPLDDWERDILDIIREETFYFYPQMLTKICNEGYASYWHAEIMYKYNGLSQTEYIDFLRDHEKVVQPGQNPFRINPYFLGFRIFKDVEKRWDKEYGEGEGKKKVIQIAKEEDDISFLRNYLTSDLIEDLKLFTYGYDKDYPKDHKREKFIEIKDRMRESVVENLVGPLYNGGVPKISIIDIGPDGKLIMKHETDYISTLDHKFAAKVLSYIWDIWAAPIELFTKNDNGQEVSLCFDESGFYEKNIGIELDLDEEEDFKSSYKGKIIIP